MASASQKRAATVSRKTKETEISVSLDIDGTGRSEIDTGVGFFDHMLDQLARHSLIDLTIAARGDRHIDDHHTVEDTGIALGGALSKALGERRGARRCRVREGRPHSGHRARGVHSQGQGPRVGGRDRGRSRAEGGRVGAAIGGRRSGARSGALTKRSDGDDRRFGSAFGRARGSFGRGERAHLTRSAGDSGRRSS